MKYNNFRQKVITIPEANKILTLLKYLNVPVIYVSRYKNTNEVKCNTKGFSYQKYAIVKENDSNIFIETSYYEPKYRATRYICNLNGELKAEVKGLQCFNKLQQHCFKAKRASAYKWTALDNTFDTDTGRYLCSAKPIIGYSSKYEKQELHDVYEYDLNSAYSSIMMKGIPNINAPYFNHKLKANQVGFFLDEDLTLMEKQGIICDIAFDIIELTD